MPVDEYNIALQTIQKYDMINKEDVVIVACSGGADSMALLFFLLIYKEKLGINVQAAHVNHAMRGENSDADENFVQEFCKKNNIKLHTTRLSPQNDFSEEWARDMRYKFLDGLARQQNIKIATAHTASDNAETVLFNLARGTSTAGASGIPCVRGAYIRPFISLERADTEKICKENNIFYVTDETNFTSQYSRGIIRNNVLPILETVHNGAARNIAKFAYRQAQLWDFVNDEARRALDNAEIKDKKERFAHSKIYSAKQLSLLPPALLSTAAAIITRPCGCLNEKLLKRATEVILGSSTSCELAAGYSLRKTANLIYLDKCYPEDKFNISLKQGEYRVLKDFLLVIKMFSKESYENLVNVQKKDLIFCADYDRIENTVVFRTRALGDKFAFRTQNLTKSVKKIMQEYGIASAARDALPILASNEKVLWMPHCGFCEGTQPSKNTKNIICITLKRDLEEL